MKRLYILLCVLSGILFHANSQNYFQYQTVLRTVSGFAEPNKDVEIKFSILQSSITGNVVYAENHQAKTDTKGFLSVQIGKGTAQVGNFSQLDWSKSSYFIKTELKKSGDSNVYSSTQELLSSPYSLFAETAGGIQKKSPNGTTFSLVVDNDGNLSTRKIESSIIPIPPGYTSLVFNDEFNGTGLIDPAKWDYEEGFYVRNGEKQYYTVAREENCFLKDGYLHIVARNDSLFIENALVRNQDSSNPRRKDTISAVTSASIHTANKFMWTYGKVEVRAKLPKSKGTWPAIWMMGDPQKYGHWPNCGEIDIMENVGFDPNKIHFSLHSFKYNGWYNTHKHMEIYAPTTYTEFHTYGLEWHEDRIEWYFDGVKRFTVRNTEGSWMSWPFDHPFYMLLGFAFGGSWGSDNKGEAGIDVTSLPQEYIIDYVRIFQ